MRKACYALRLLPAVLVYAADRASKVLAEQWLLGRELVELLPGFNLVLVYNRGASFGFLAEQDGWQRWFLISVSLIVIGVLLVWLQRLPPGHRRLGIALSLVLGGAAGNLHDRILSGAVTDFIDLYYRHWHWPAFNLADSAITCGAALYLWWLLRPGRPDAPRESA